MEKHGANAVNRLRAETFSRLHSAKSLIVEALQRLESSEPCNAECVIKAALEDLKTAQFSARVVARWDNQCQPSDAAAFDSIGGFE